jgi:uncharacterized membrane protein
MEVKMSNLTVSTAPSVRSMMLRTLLTSVVVAALIVAVAVTAYGGPAGWASFARMFGGSHLHAPRLDLIAAAPLVVQVHLVTVLAAFALATAQLLGAKGTPLHRAMGWALAAMFVATALDSLFIRNPGSGLFNPFQFFSIWTLIAIPLALVAARRHNVAFHARMMTGFYVGALIVAGVLTFIPGRLMWRVFFG